MFCGSHGLRGDVDRRAWRCDAEFLEPAAEIGKVNQPECARVVLPHTLPNLYRYGVCTVPVPPDVAEREVGNRVKVLRPESGRSIPTRPGRRRGLSKFPISGPNDFAVMGLHLDVGLVSDDIAGIPVNAPAEESTEVATVLTVPKPHAPFPLAVVSESESSTPAWPTQAGLQSGFDLTSTLYRVTTPHFGSGGVRSPYAYKIGGSSSRGALFGCEKRSDMMNQSQNVFLNCTTDINGDGC